MKILRKLRLCEISAVDSPAQIGASVVLMKRRDVAKNLGCEYQNPVMLTDVEGHAHIIDASSRGGETSYDKMPGEEYGHSHPWIMSLEGGITIGAANGHTHSVLAKRSTTQPTGDQTVTDQKNTPTVETLTKQLETATAELAVMKSMLALNDEQRVFHGTLDEAGRTEFMKLSATDRQARIDAKKGENPVVFKSEQGVEFRKNDDPRLVEMAKRLDDESKLRKASDEKIARTAFEKRATDEFPKLPGTMDVKVAVLKAFETIADQPTRDAAIAMLKAGNAGVTGAFDSKGVTGGSGEDATPVQKLDTIAKAIQIEKKCSYVDAYELARVQNPALYEQAVNAKA